MNNKNKKVLAILSILFVLLMVGAALSYDTLIAKFSPSNSIGDSSNGSINDELPRDDTEEDADSLIPAPNFTLIDADGNETNLSDYIGKPVVLNFWASWCPPCKSEMPYFDELYSEIGEDVVFIMLDSIGMRGETQKDAEKYIKSEGFSFPVYFDNHQEAIALYGINSIPATFFIDAQGNLVTYHNGAMSKEQLLEGISYITE